jgi:hypothetical protein
MFFKRNQLQKAQFQYKAINKSQNFKIMLALVKLL